MILIGVDTGGTFTDFVFKQGDQWGVYKVLSTPSKPETAVLEGLRHVSGKMKKQVIHGSTVATNAILERKGAKTALMTNRGFEDVIEIGRQNRCRLYDLAYHKHPHIVSPDLRFGIQGRIRHTGEELESLNLAAAKKVVQRLKRLEVESVAVCFLFSYINPSHERMTRELLEPMGVHVSLSHETLAEFREFERISTTVVNAYVSPKMAQYIGTLKRGLDAGDRLSIMQSNGGRISADTAMRESIRTILSGPAGGVVGAYEIGRAAGYSKLITFDMGGTSTDVSLINKGLSLTTESEISGYPIRLPTVDIHTVGAGGGSIAALDMGGALKVGPESAGAGPGPICYGKGNQITVTDAHLFLGRLIPDHFLGGTMKLEPDRLGKHFSYMAKETGLTPSELAQGILSIADAAMEKAVRVISIEKGYDPREFTLFSFGGAGGMHAAFLAKLLNIPKILIPPNPGILSAIGMLMADVIKDYSFTLMRNQAMVTGEELSELFTDLEKRGRNELRSESFDKKNVVLERYLDMRYEGQSFEIIVPFDHEYIENFHRLHERTYGYRIKDRAVEIVNMRLRARRVPVKPKFQRTRATSDKPSKAAFLGQADVVFDRKVVKTPIIARDKLVSGNKIKGPGIVVEYSATIVIPPFADACVDGYGNMILEILG